MAYSLLKQEKTNSDARAWQDAYFNILNPSLSKSELETIIKSFYQNMLMIAKAEYKRKQDDPIVALDAAFSAPIFAFFIVATSPLLIPSLFYMFSKNMSHEQAPKILLSFTKSLLAITLMPLVLLVTAACNIVSNLIKLAQAGCRAIESLTNNSPSLQRPAMKCS